MHNCNLYVQAAKRELERQRQLEWERQRRQELLTQRNREQESIVMLKARKKTLEFELEALVIKHGVYILIMERESCFCNLSARAFIDCSLTQNRWAEDKEDNLQIKTDSFHLFVLVSRMIRRPSWRVN